MAAYLFKHQQLGSCTLGMWLLSLLSVFYPLLSHLGTGFLALTPFVIVHHLTHRNHTVQTLSFREAAARNAVQGFKWEWVLGGSTQVLSMLVCKISQERREATESLPHHFLALCVCSDQFTLSCSPLIHLLIYIYPIFILISMLAFSIPFLSSIVDTSLNKRTVTRFSASPLPSPKILFHFVFSKHYKKRTRRNGVWPAQEPS